MLLTQFWKGFFYMDDYSNSFNENYCRCCSFFKTWRFDLAQFISNSRDILSEISSDNLSPNTVNLDLDKRPTEMALGISLNSNPDMLTLNVVNKNIPKINRGIFSMVNSIFNPMELVLPIIIKANFQCTMSGDGVWGFTKNCRET